jgi:DNA-binding response OmpR family regulator
MNILVIEDDDLTADFIKRALKQDGHYVRIAYDGLDGFNKALKSSTTDAIILDIVLPNKDGLSICKDLRRNKITTPILMLSSHAHEQARVDGLDAGADDYLVKPFSYKELAARLRAITRRPSIVLQSQLAVGNLRLNPETREVYKNEVKIELRPKEFALLEYMMRNPDIVLPRHQLLNNVWHIRSEASSNRLEVYIRHLRQKIDSDPDSHTIQTIHSIGYKLVSK